MNKNRIILFTILSLFLLITIPFQSIAEITPTFHQQQIHPSKSQNTSAPYEGYLRIYIVEPNSRWNMYDNRSYHNGFLDFAHQEQLSIDYQETQKNTITWQGDITEDNVLVIAAIFNPTANIGYSLPPNQYPFEAYYVDGSAAARPGETGSNIRNGSITHTVFIEEATATWCKNCKAMDATTFRDPKVEQLLKKKYVLVKYQAERPDEPGTKELLDYFGVVGLPTYVVLQPK